MVGFYDELAPIYHLMFDDWDASIQRQGSVLAQIIRTVWPGSSTVLDASCGIGTQAIGLALSGFQMSGSDISSRAIDRAMSEAHARKVEIALSICDMRQLFGHHGKCFDVVIACDNAMPHLLTDGDITIALGQIFNCLYPGGGCLLTVRDYDEESRGRNILKPISALTCDGSRHVVLQIWDFVDSHYDLTLLFIEENLSSHQVTTRAMRSRYYAIGVSRLMALMRDAGFTDVQRIDEVFYQPVLLGTKPGQTRIEE